MNKQDLLSANPFPTVFDVLARHLYNYRGQWEPAEVFEPGQVRWEFILDGIKMEPSGEMVFEGELPCMATHDNFVRFEWWPGDDFLALDRFEKTPAGPRHDQRDVCRVRRLGNGKVELVYYTDGVPESRLVLAVVQ